ncbi:hypothetical protein SB658_27445, partial [Bacillus sp. SIMBA_008]|uniref:hypothetical protein n=1 Tax=Bacillus sp. SIMBA_008 TaxID=3085757 RepID=UPI00397A6C46
MGVLHRGTDAKYLPELEAAAPHLEDLQAYLESVFDEGDFTPASLWDRARRDATLAEFAPTYPKSWDLFEGLDAGQIRQ